jgi:hypothetical protein
VAHFGSWTYERRAANVGAGLDTCAFCNLDIATDVGARLNLTAYPRPEDGLEVVRQTGECLPGVGALGEQAAMLPARQIE